MGKRGNVRGLPSQQRRTDPNLTFRLPLDLAQVEAREWALQLPTSILLSFS